MCGITGFLNPSGLNGIKAKINIVKMRNALRHRGPDDSGEWIDNKSGIALGHQRLSILDVSSAGHQPMESKTGRYVMVYNGEIYNHLEIRKEINNLTSINWNGHSDTETLLVSFDIVGFRKTLKKIVGAFSIALWDKKRKVLLLARDRMGEKPLYYGWQNGVFLFGSELKALRKHDAFEDVINRKIIPSYLKTGAISAPNSIYEGIYKVIPSTYIEITPHADKNTMPQANYYWSLDEIARNGVRSPLTGNIDELIEELEELIKQSVCLQTISDVPLGAYLSGGIDSSLIVALLQLNSMKKVKTFTIGFEENKYDESIYAQSVANYLGTDHTSLYLTKKEIIRDITETQGVYDEPLSDTSASLRVATLAKRDVKVALCGDGGDELFAGYTHYSKISKISKIIDAFPGIIRPVISKIGTSLPSKLITVASEPFLNLFKISIATPLGLKIHKLARIFNIRDHNVLYNFVKTSGMIEESLVNKEYREIYTYNYSINNFDNIIDTMIFCDQKDYLSSDILVKSDRNSMSVGIENRAPLLDHRIVEMAWKFPLNLKIRNGVAKWPLRQILHKYVPAQLVDRPKMGFGIPAEEWLRGPLKSWASELLSPESLIKDKFFDVENVQYILKQHMEGKYNWQVVLWRLCAFQEWLKYR
ncbi:asparagine synthase (glutamine-hydrolyzing) [Alphaproteobacteria bacterium]|nr:asparagine synthase (glutamine-hydrolyzing) [Alphaproteobacteria bacterium]MDC1085869.1 asparagine synthase (glutamine-hydrolyzing) [Alphaproteobacteria bacterium]